MQKLNLPFAEIMITQVCNLSCVGCTNYSDLIHKGYLTWEQGKSQILPWLNRVNIEDFGILGGEPTLNPEVIQWIYGLRDIMPDAQIRFTTNGAQLRKKFDIVKSLAEIGNCVFKIAFHKDDPDLEDLVNEIMSMYKWETVTEYDIERYKTDNNFRFYVRRPQHFWKTFIGSYNDMKPHSSNPADAFKLCCQQTCPLLYNGKLYKCSTNGLLDDTLRRFNYPNRDMWAEFLVPGLESTCSDQDLEQYLDNFGKPNKVCKMCPSEKDAGSKIIHLENVFTRKLK